MIHERKIHRENFSWVEGVGGGGRRVGGMFGLWIWLGIEKGETLHIQKCETVSHAVYEKERNFHNSVLLRNFPEINLN